jgi:hypothetical protein
MRRGRFSEKRADPPGVSAEWIPLVEISHQHNGVIGMKIDFVDQTEPLLPTLIDSKTQMGGNYFQ